MYTATPSIYNGHINQATTTYWGIQMSKHTKALADFKALIARLNAEDRMFHMDDDILEHGDLFTFTEKVEFGVIIDAARRELSADEFDNIAYGGKAE
jgi:hypothetical protein